MYVSGLVRYFILVLSKMEVGFWQSRYGVVRIISGYIPGTNNAFTWFCSGDYSDFLSWNNSTNSFDILSEEFFVTATVKQHKEDSKFGNSTILTRVKIGKKKVSKKEIAAMITPEILAMLGGAK